MAMGLGAASRHPGIAFRAPGATGEIITPARPLIRPLDTIPWPVRERDLDGYFKLGGSGMGNRHEHGDQ